MKPELERVTLYFHKGDKEIISKYFPRTGYSEPIRNLIHKFANKLRERDSEITAEAALEEAASE